jgi:hypothetical protein
MPEPERQEQQEQNLAADLVADFALEVRKAVQILRQAYPLVGKVPLVARLEIDLQETAFLKVQNPQTDYYTCLHTFLLYNLLIQYVTKYSL